MNGEGNPSLLAQLLAAVVTILAAVGGYISSLVITNTKKIYGMEALVGTAEGNTKKIYSMDQNMTDLRDTINRLHSEEISRHEGIISRLSAIEERLRHIEMTAVQLEAKVDIIVPPNSR